MIPDFARKVFEGCTSEVGLHMHICTAKQHISQDLLTLPPAEGGWRGR